MGALVPLSAGLAVNKKDFQSFLFTATEPPVREGAHREFPIPKCNNNATLNLKVFNPVRSESEIKFDSPRRITLQHNLPPLPLKRDLIFGSLIWRGIEGRSKRNVTIMRLQNYNSNLILQSRQVGM